MNCNARSTPLTLFQWPLDKRPPYYANQGDRFSDILHMLLKMRSLPPKTTVRADNGILKAVEGGDENATRWFDLIQVSRTFVPLLFSPVMLTLVAAVYFLEERQNAIFDPSDSRSLDLRYGAKLLQPTAA